MSEYASLKKDLSEWATKAKEIVDHSIKSNVEAKAQEILTVAKELAPESAEGQTGKYAHKPGNLRDSIYMKVSAGGHFAKIGVDIKKAYYAFMVHFGTVKMTGRPFLYQAKERVMGDFTSDIHAAIKEGD